MSLIDGIKAGAKTAARGARVMLQAKGPTIMVVGGTVMVLVAGVWACVKTYNELDAVLARHEDAMADIRPMKDADNPNRGEYGKTVAKLYCRTGLDIAKVYAGPITVGTLGTVGILCGHNILNQRHAKLVMAYQALSATTNSYRSRVADKVGAEEEANLWRGTEQQPNDISKNDQAGTAMVNAKPSANREAGTNPYIFRLNEDTCRYWQDQIGYNYMFLKIRMATLNDELHAGKRISMNEVIDQLGIIFDDPEREEYVRAIGSIMGWSGNEDVGDGYIDFGIDKFRENGFVSDYGEDGFVRTILANQNNEIWIELNVDEIPIYEIGNFIHFKSIKDEA